VPGVWRAPGRVTLLGDPRRLAVSIDTVVGGCRVSVFATEDPVIELAASWEDFPFETALDSLDDAGLLDQLPDWAKATVQRLISLEPQTGLAITLDAPPSPFRNPAAIPDAVSAAIADLATAAVSLPITAPPIAAHAMLHSPDSAETVAFDPDAAGLQLLAIDLNLTTAPIASAPPELVLRLAESCAAGELWDAAHQLTDWQDELSRAGGLEPAALLAIDIMHAFDAFGATVGHTGDYAVGLLTPRQARAAAVSIRSAFNGRGYAEPRGYLVQPVLGAHRIQADTPDAESDGSVVARL
jgi:hypothetical protein